MKRWEALEIFGRLQRDVIVVYGPGGLSSELDAESPSELNIYSPMPYPTPFGLGLALALPKRKVIVMEGDGSALSGLTALPTLATVGPRNLVNMVWDNGTWFSSGTMGTKAHYGPVPAPTAVRTDLAAHAKASGFDRVFTVQTLEEFEKCFASGAVRRSSILYRRQSRTDGHAGDHDQTGRHCGRGN